MKLNLTEEQIEQAASDDCTLQKKYNNAYDRKQGFKAGVKWMLSVIKEKEENRLKSVNQLPGVDSSQVKPSDPQIIRGIF